MPCPTTERGPLTYIGTHKRLLDTWNQHKPPVCKLLHSTIKADLQNRILAAVPGPEEDPDYTINIGDCSDFEYELLKELQENVQPKTLLSRIAKYVFSQHSISTQDAPQGILET